MHADFFFDVAAHAADTGAVAAVAFSLLRLPDFERRESENYAGGEYFCVTSEGLAFELAINEYSDGVQLGYWLSIEDFEGSDEKDFEQRVDRYMSWGMREGCDRIARVYDFGKKSMRVAML